MLQIPVGILVIIKGRTEVMPILPEVQRENVLSVMKFIGIDKAKSKIHLNIVKSLNHYLWTSGSRPALDIPSVKGVSSRKTPRLTQGEPAFTQTELMPSVGNVILHWAWL